MMSKLLMKDDNVKPLQNEVSENGTCFVSGLYANQASCQKT